MFSYNYETPKNIMINNSGVYPRIYKIATKSHNYTQPVKGSALFAWECPYDKNPPHIYINWYGDSVRPKLTVSGDYADNFYGVCKRSVQTDNAAVVYKGNSKISATTTYTNKEYTGTKKYTAVFAGMKFTPTYTDKTADSKLSIFNGNTAHINNVRTSVWGTAPCFRNSILIRYSSSGVPIVSSRSYYGYNSSSGLIDITCENNVYYHQGTAFTYKNDGYLYKLISNVAKINDSENLIVGNGFEIHSGSQGTSATNLWFEILGVYMSVAYNNSL